MLETTTMFVPTSALRGQDGASVGLLVLADTAHFFTFKVFPPFLVPCKERRRDKTI